MRTLMVALLLVSSGFAQSEPAKAWEFEGALQAPQTLPWPEFSRPRLWRLVIDRVKGDLRLRRGPRAWNWRTCGVTGSRAEAWVERWAAGAPPVVVEPVPASGEGEAPRCRLRWIPQPTAIFDLEARSGSTMGKSLAAVVEVIARDGSELPNFLESGLPQPGPAWFVPAKGRAVLVPADRGLRLLGWSHPLRNPVERRLRPRAGRRAGVQFALGEDRRPASFRHQYFSGEGRLAKRWIRLFEYDDQDATLRPLDARLFSRARRAVPAILEAREGQTVVRAAKGPGGLPLGARGFSTYRSLAGIPLHTNGLLMTVTRCRAQGAGTLVSIEGRVECAATLTVYSVERELLKQSEAGSFKLVFNCPPGIPIVLHGQAQAPGQGLSLATPRQAYIPLQTSSR